MDVDPIAKALLDAWFEGDPSVARAAWFRVDRAFDERLRATFGATVERAIAGDFEGWRGTPEGTIALVLLLDQLPRNLFRGTPRAFAGDARARAIAGDAIARGVDASLPIMARTFFGMPLQHAEDRALQDEGVRYFERLLAEAPEASRAPVASGLDYARRHRDIVARFGRFPHRNATLGRESTPEEIAFLKTPGSSF
jgi:uncharacterized protein (DUF924 family)